MPAESQHPRHWLRLFLIAVALLYAFLAGLHTVDDMDLGWQMATARYVFQHHHFPATTLYNYTVPDYHFIYSPFSGIVFYLLYLAGGFAALSIFHALACAGTVALLVYDGGKTTAALAILAVPAIMFRTNLRADLFSVVLFAALTAGLWRYYQGRPFHLWLLPVFLLLWANLHPGFIFGIGMMGAYVMFEACDIYFPERRAAAIARLHKAVPWMASALFATLINPWGFALHKAVIQQGKLTAFQTAFVTEWMAVQFNARSLYEALHPRNPVSGDWWFMAIGALVLLAFAVKKRFGPAILLAALLYVSIQHLRFQTVYAIAVVVLGGAMLPEIAEDFVRLCKRVAHQENPAGPATTSRSSFTLAGALAVLLFGWLSFVRIGDLVSNRYFVDGLPTSLFGTGLSWWFPERATSFLLENRLPGNVFHDFNVGGYLTWRIGERYPDFADGRVIPFVDGAMDEQARILSLPPDSLELREEADRWNLQTMLFSVGRFAGLGSFPLPEYCASRNWKLVYADDVSMIFLRNAPGNQGLIAKFAKECRTTPFAAPALAGGISTRARGERFNYLMNASAIFFLLQRDAEAWANLAEAEKLFPEASSLHMAKAQFLAAENRTAQAEAEYLLALRQGPCDECWHGLARLYASEHRYKEAEHALKESAALSLSRHERYRSLGQLYLMMNEPQQALADYARAESLSPYRGDSAGQGKMFRAQIAEGRARAYQQLHDLDQAVEQEEIAVRLDAENPARWQALADLYLANGQKEKATEARSRAEDLEKAAVEAAKPATIPLHPSK